MPAPGSLDEPLLGLAACWNEVGIAGNGTCPELRRFIHCRNCPVYSAAGAQVLDRSLPADYRAEQSQQFAVEQRRSRPGHASAVLFRLGDEWLALPTKAIQEVAERRPIHSLPHRPNGIVLGVTNVRGELLICVSLADLLKIGGLVTGERLRSCYQRLLVVNWEGSRMAFPAEETQGPCRFYPQELQPSPVTLARAKPSHTQGLIPWQRRNASLLDPASLFAELNRNLK